MKHVFKYSLTFLACVAGAFLLSWSAVYSYWFAARIFRSVAAIRVADTVSNIVLLPVRTLFWMAGDVFDQSAPLSDPITYASVNAVLLGVLCYMVCRVWFLEEKPGE